MAFDFVIVGGGAHGCATAFHLAKGGASVVVIDAKEIASGASGGAGKRGVRANRRDLRELELMRQAYDLWPALGEHLGEDIGYVRTGGVYLIEKDTSGSTGGMVAAQVQADVQSGLGIPTEFWSEDMVRERLPAAAATIKGGLFAPLDGVSSHEATTKAYARAAQRYGAVLMEETEVTSIVTDPTGQATGVRTANEETVEARQAVVLTNNLGCVELVRSATGFTIPIWPILPQALLLKSQYAPEIPYLTAHDSRALSVKLLDDDVIMLSGGWRGRWNTEKSVGETIPENVEGSMAQLAAVFPHLGELTLLAADASRSESAAIDQIPFIDIVPGTTNIVVATGWTGHGWALVPSVSQHLAGWLSTGNKPQILAPFAFTRTSENR